jgi:hypothetical protein
MLAYYLSCPMRLWLNDIQNGSYGNALPGLAAIDTITQQVLALPAIPNSAPVVCGEPWPDSLTQPHRTNLTDTLTAWGETPHARIGFLDPMRYRINNGKVDETDSLSHQRWLGLLATGDACSVISVHFTGHNNWTTLRPEIQNIHDDGVASGYHHTLVARHSYYHAVCNIRSSQGLEATRALAYTLQQAVQDAWASWFQTIGRAADALAVDVL